MEQKLLQLLGRADKLMYQDKTEKDLINKKIALYSEKIFGDKDKYGVEAENIPYSLYVDHCPESEQRRVWEQGKGCLINLIETMLEDYQLSVNDVGRNDKMMNNKKIFIVHGHNETLKLEVENWLYSLELKPIVLHKQANVGVKSIIDKLARYSDVKCAIILMTADDKGKAKKDKVYNDRARQNVVFEAGYFIGKLKPENVILLYEEGVEIPGDLGGCVYIKADRGDNWKEEVRREFNAMEVDYLK